VAFADSTRHATHPPNDPSSPTETASPSPIHRASGNPSWLLSGATNLAHLPSPLSRVLLTIVGQLSPELGHTRSLTTSAQTLSSPLRQQKQTGGIQKSQCKQESETADNDNDRFRRPPHTPWPQCLADFVNNLPRFLGADHQDKPAGKKKYAADSPRPRTANQGSLGQERNQCVLTTLAHRLVVVAIRFRRDSALAVSNSSGKTTIALLFSRATIVTLSRWYVR